MRMEDIESKDAKETMKYKTKEAEGRRMSKQTIPRKWMELLNDHVDCSQEQIAVGECCRRLKEKDA